VLDAPTIHTNRLIEFAKRDTELALNWNRAWSFLRGDRPVRNAIARVLWATGLCRYFVVKRPGFFIRFHPTSVSCTYWVDAEARAEDERTISALLLPDSTYVDVGANVGTLALAGAAATGPMGKVVAIEAHPRTTRFLKDNVRENGMCHVTVVCAAVGDKEGSVVIENRRADDMNQVSITGNGPNIPMRTLDDILAGVGGVRLLKIDVEGFEKFVLAGAPRTLARTEFVFIEIIASTAAHFGYDVADVMQMLRTAGFECYRLAADGVWQMAELAALDSRGENILAAREPRALVAAGLPVRIAS
jgi:FkbM family methyltransferase